MPQLPLIAIVGRPNVGKSSLLNALVGKRISIVQDMPGVTRDRVSYPLRIDGRYVELVDTGGYGYIDPDQLTEHIKHQIELAMGRADLVLFLVDAQAGRTTADEEIAAMLRRLDRKVILVANKADGPSVDVILGDFARLGFGTPIGVSAMNDRNLDQLVAAVRSNVDLSAAPQEIPDPQLLLAIVGKRNAGKSTLVNSIARLYEDDPAAAAGAGDRVIVSEVPGTTRDSVDVRIEKEGKTLVVIDTAGVRKKRHMVTNDIEFYSFHRAQRSIRRADVVMLLVDGTEPVSEPDKKLSQYVAEQYKPVVLVVNKWDLAREKVRELHADEKDVPSDTELMEQFREYLDAELPHVDFAPIAFVTAKDGKNIQSVLDLAQHLFKQANIRLGTGPLNRAVRQILQERTPPTPGGRRARVYYATQIDVSPPTLVLFVNNPEFIDEAYQRYMINRFRELLPYAEVPIRLVVRPRSERGAGAGVEDDHNEDRAKGLAPRRAKRPKAAAARARPQRAAKSKSGPKPHPKPAGRKGPRRGTRPH